MSSATDIDSLGERPVSLEILNGGKYYFTADAYASVAEKTCQVASLRAKRRLDATDQQWKVEVCKRYRPGANQWKIRSLLTHPLHVLPKRTEEFEK